MTWNAFKALVDAQIKGDEKIHYIDISYPEPDSIEITVDGDDELRIEG